MDREFVQYFSSGEFAKLCGVNKKTLFHYDNIGLFSPEIVKDNGYRYYSHNQIDIFIVILSLKEVGMSLLEIKDFIDNRNPNKLLEVFKDQKEIVDKEIEKLKNISSLIETKIKITEEGRSINKNIFKLEEQEEELLFLSNKLKSTNLNYDVTTFMDHVKERINRNIVSGYPIGVIISKEALISKRYTDYDYFYTKLNAENKNVEAIVKPKGLYAVAYMKGYYDKTSGVYKELLEFIKDNNLYISGYSYEDGLLDDISVSKHDDFVQKISIKVDYIN